MPAQHDNDFESNVQWDVYILDVCLMSSGWMFLFCVSMLVVSNMFYFHPSNLTFAYFSNGWEKNTN